MAGLKPGRTGFTPQNRLTAEFTQDVYINGLPRVRAAALAWRNGIGALLAGVIGFGLVKGRSEVGELSSPYDVVVGVLLALALACGAVAAFLLLRAAHGRPAPVARRALLQRRRTNLKPLSPDHRETRVSARALRAGVLLAALCLGLLTTAVGTTWYGPAKSALQIQVWPGNGGIPVCGSVLSVSAGELVLTTDHGEQTVDLGSSEGLQALDSCPKPVP